jgi:hydrogenase maturation protein HypF
MVVRKRLAVAGVVQGVGFRPFVYQLAVRHGLGGWVLNDAEGVKIEVEGPWEAINRFVHDLQTELPPLAKIAELAQTFAPALGETSFSIRESRAGAGRSALISPDTNVCADCLRELFDPADRRFRYPFINCTNCGPRYTIVTDIPYDRPNTTMKDFPMCALCSREYHDPADRRFHAQPVACPECGPSVELWDAAGRRLDVPDPIRETAARLKRGEILAIKGLGGFHLACDATNEETLRELRRRKRREEKPFAVMSNDLENVMQYAEADEAERELLLSFRRPIVLLRKREPERLAPSVAPRNRSYGVMLPCTPIQHLLLAEGRGATALPRQTGAALARSASCAALVMTSANLTDEPLCISNGEAIVRLRGIADGFLVHNRDICARSDDSIARVMAGRERLLRRARGYVPLPILLKRDGPKILAVGAELKGAICLTKGRNAFLSQHLGDLKNAQALDFFEETVAHLCRILEIEPEAVAHDLHPDYFSTRHARQLKGRPLVGVQHHHAHVAAVLAEHGEEGPVLGVALDGAGYGSDGTIWGGEFLIADLRDFRRVGHLAPMPLPGGDAAVAEPWRTAVAYLHAAFGPEWANLDIPFVKRMDMRRARLVVQMVASLVNTPFTTSTGRLFDAVASLLGICDRNTHEGQAPMELEAAADLSAVAPALRSSAASAGEEESAKADEVVTNALPFEIRRENGVFLLDPRSYIRAVVERLRGSAPAETISAEFHNGLRNGVVAMCERIRKAEKISRVALSGGVFQNKLLFERTVRELERKDFRVLTHQLVPPNDGCIALGQAAVARARQFGAP